MEALDEFAKLTDEDKRRLLWCKQGSQYTASARTRMSEFAIERGWSPEILNDILLLLPRTDP